MADDYVCTLSEASIKKARKELSEDPKERLSHVESFRSWIMQQKHFDCPTGTEYLLRYLRHCKFSQLRARKMLENFMKLRVENKLWFCDVDLTDPMITRFLREGYYLPMERRDKEGRKVVIMRPGAFTSDSKIYDKDVLVKAMFGLNAYIMADENTMVNGVTILLDLSGFGLKHQTFWGMDTVTQTTKMWQNKMPGRMKGFHYYNIGPVFESILAIMKTVMSKKFQDRIVLHGKNMENVYKCIPMECLPREYLPDEYSGYCQGTVDDIVESLVNDLKRPEVRDRSLYESKSSWKYDETKKTLDVPNESFRKLNID